MKSVKYILYIVKIPKTSKYFVTQAFDFTLYMNIKDK